MLRLSDPGWARLQHAYGTAANIPALLERALAERRPGSHPESVWFELWSALCHQGDAYTASYAAVPHLISLAPKALAQQSYEPLLLAASIERARLEGTGPAVPTELLADYEAAVRSGRDLARAALPAAWNADAHMALAGSLAALSGDVAGARTVFEADLESEG